MVLFAFDGDSVFVGFVLFPVVDGVAFAFGGFDGAFYFDFVDALFSSDGFVGCFGADLRLFWVFLAGVDDVGDSDDVVGVFFGCFVGDFSCVGFFFTFEFVAYGVVVGVDAVGSWFVFDEAGGAGVERAVAFDVFVFSGYFDFGGDYAFFECLASVGRIGFVFDLGFFGDGVGGAVAFVDVFGFFGYPVWVFCVFGVGGVSDVLAGPFFDFAVFEGFRGFFRAGGGVAVDVALAFVFAGGEGLFFGFEVGSFFDLLVVRRFFGFAGVDLVDAGSFDCVWVVAGLFVAFFIVGADGAVRLDVSASGFFVLALYDGVVDHLAWGVSCSAVGSFVFDGFFEGAVVSFFGAGGASFGVCGVDEVFGDGVVAVFVLGDS